MGLFRKKPVCRKFFTYETKTLDISGISAGLSGAEKAQFNFGLGELKISPEFVRVSEILMQKDIEQFTLCQQIANISDRAERDRYFIELVKIRLEMMRMAANPTDYERNQNHSPATENQSATTPLKSNLQVSKAQSGLTDQILTLLNDPGNINQALQLADQLSFNSGDRFLFNQKRLKYEAGMDDYQRMLWIGEMKDFISKYRS